jgi:hypothetical protein
MISNDLARLTIYLRVDQARKLRSRSSRSGASLSELLRRLLDSIL